MEIFKIKTDSIITELKKKLCSDLMKKFLNKEEKPMSM